MKQARQIVIENSTLPPLCQSDFSSLEYVSDEWFEKKSDLIVQYVRALPESVIEPVLALITRMHATSHFRGEGQNLLKTLAIPRLTRVGCSKETLTRVLAMMDLGIIVGTNAAKIIEIAWTVGIEEGVLATSKVKGDLFEKISSHQFANENEKERAFLQGLRCGDLTMERITSYLSELNNKKKAEAPRGSWEEKKDLITKIERVEEVIRIVILRYGFGITPFVSEFMNIILGHLSLANFITVGTVAIILSNLELLYDQVKGSLNGYASLLLPLFLQYVQNNISSEQHIPTLLQVKILATHIKEEAMPFISKEDVECLGKLLSLFD
ncbi:hypothetical protein EIN_153790 [Entamoeba invadens IP1]|uniref:Uncharacterized protein n=1 Tax=Entamoeba invadens IP1 TaxID=370355 RepID=A0A0A1U915_ENTIV|nr:hypothetical protein EIN_153790 [Entamoeba invadens IP1]ELP91342.1 hypothetical protein EIN_153790 [Entamoeba invadens IP1]|eukprot:XP_004258113.1 hypothetical protein EIN_153790 [Entamoeba invadens IP1]